MISYVADTFFLGSKNMETKPVGLYMNRKLYDFILLMAEKQSVPLAGIYDTIIEQAYISSERGTKMSGDKADFTVRMYVRTHKMLKELAKRDGEVFADLLLRGVRSILRQKKFVALTLIPLPCVEAYAFPRLKASGKTRFASYIEALLNSRRIRPMETRILSFPDDIFIVAADREWCNGFNFECAYPLMKEAMLQGVRRISAIVPEDLCESSPHLDAEVVLFLRSVAPNLNIDAKVEIKAARAVIRIPGRYVTKNRKDGIAASLLEEFDGYFSDVVFEE